MTASGMGFPTENCDRGNKCLQGWELCTDQGGNDVGFYEIT